MANLQSGAAPGLDHARVKRNAIRMALVTFGAAVPAFLMYLFLGWRLGDWQFYALAVDVAVFLVIAPLCILLFRRDKVYLGLTILCAAILLVVLVGGLLVDGLGVVLGLALLASMPLLITQLMLPPRHTRIMIGVTIVTGVLSVLLDFYWPFPGTRLIVLPEIRTLFVFITIGGIAMPFYFIARQFRDYTLRSKFIIVSIVIALIPIVLISARLNARATRLTRESADLALQSAAQQTATRVDTFIATSLVHLSVEAELPDLVAFLIDGAQPGVREDALEALHALSRKPYVSSYALLDSQGRNVLDTLAANIGRAEGAADYFRQPFATSQPHVASVVLEDDGEVYVHMGQHVTHPNGQDVIGVLRARYRFDVWQDMVAQSNDLVGERSHAVLVDHNMLRLAHGIAPAARRAPVAPELAAALRAREPFFTGELDVGPEAYRTRGAIVPLESQGWHVVFVQSEQIILAPVEAQTREVVVLGMIVAGVMALAGVGVAQYLSRPIATLTEVAEAVAAGNLEAHAVAQTNDEIGVLADTFNVMTGRLRGLIADLEARVAERTEALQHRTAYLEAAAEVSRSVGAVLEQDALIQEATQLVLQSFSLYHVGFALLDDEGREAIYVGGAGQAAQALREQAFRLELGGDSLLARCLRSERPVAVQDVRAEPDYVGHPLLPDTRSEAVLPFKARGRVLGGMSAQSSQVDAFDADTLNALSIIADQVAVGFDNLRLLRESRQALEAERRAYGEISRAAWLDMLRAGLTPGYRYVDDRVEPIGDVWQPEMEAALQQGRAIISEQAAEDAPAATFAIPIQVRGQTIGVLDVRRPVEAGRWSDAEVTLLETLAAQLEVALEGARLYQDTQRRAAREQVAGEITGRIRETLDMEQVLQIAVCEIGSSLGVEAEVWLGMRKEE